MHRSALPAALALALAACAHADPAPAPVSSPAPAPAPEPAPAAAAVPAPTAPRAFRVEVSGHGPPVILIPGLGSSGEVWDTTVAHLRAHYTCHVVTLAGFAGVPAIADPVVATARRELATYITAHHLDHPVIIGHSLGGTLALALAADHPDAIGPLVIVDALPFLAGTMLGVDSAAQAAPVVDQVVAAMSAQPAAQYEAFVRAGRSTRGMVTSDADHQRIVGWTLASDRRAFTGAMAEVLRTDLRPALPRIASPALVIGTWIGWRPDGGDAARREAVQVFARQYAGLAHLHFVMADHARHFVMLDDLPWLLAELDRFLAAPDAAVHDRGVPAT